ncbi:MAG: hypothetical protein NC912_00045 [Candidatus Omnitrophica bacterium]|nr:hypothetical protein [Candidatus Omnitrophota bacterium]
MLNKLERVIQRVYKVWKKEQKESDIHPDEETLTCFLESRLSSEDSEEIKRHLISCKGCMERVNLLIRLEEMPLKEFPQQLLANIASLLPSQTPPESLEVVLQFKEDLIRILKTTGEILLGKELISQAVLRSRQIKDFKDELRIAKDFKEFKIEIKIINKKTKAFDLSIIVRKRRPLQLMKDLRITLIKDDTELESYLSSSGKVTFEGIPLGTYTIQVSRLKELIGYLHLEVKT